MVVVWTSFLLLFVVVVAGYGRGCFVGWPSGEVARFLSVIRDVELELDDDDEFVLELPLVLEKVDDVVDSLLLCI